MKPETRVHAERLLFILNTKTNKTNLGCYKSGQGLPMYRGGDGAWKKVQGKEASRILTTNNRPSECIKHV